MAMKYVWFIMLSAILCPRRTAFAQPLFLPPEQGGDINEDGSLVHPSSWEVGCDPWKERPIDVDLDFLNDTDLTLDDYDDWECPVEMRSVSGCGDFLLDTRGNTTICDERGGKPLPRCSDQRVVNVAQPLVPQYHVCFQHPVGPYENYGTVEGLGTPPMIGRHRPWWAKWGEYEVRTKTAALRYCQSTSHALFISFVPCLSMASLHHVVPSSRAMATKCQTRWCDLSLPSLYFSRRFVPIARVYLEPTR